MSSKTNHNVKQLFTLKIAHTTKNLRENKIKHLSSNPYHETTSIGLEGASLYKVPRELIDPSEPVKSHI